MKERLSILFIEKGHLDVLVVHSLWSVNGRAYACSGWRCMSHATAIPYPISHCTFLHWMEYENSRYAGLN